MDRTAFQIDVSDEASRDIEGILGWTIERFGLDAELRYRRLIAQALRDLERDPRRPESRQLRGLPNGVLAYPLYFSRARARSELGVVKKPRHFVVYRVEGPLVVVLRLLHDEQDFGRKLHSPD